tara:strand:- start:499 stop:771 length:273 start_codon:yes stop_codon:yes gene_type:complete
MAYNDKTTAAKTAQHPHSKLKSQKELKAITDSEAYKNADYEKQTEMLGGKVYHMKKGGKVKKNTSRELHSHGGSVGSRGVAKAGFGIEIK